jgi:copper binding protein CusF
VRGRVYEVSGTYLRRVGELTILVRHDAAPDLGMRPMELMAFSLESAAVLEQVPLASGDRVRLRVRARPDGLVVTRLERLRDRGPGRRR